MFFVVVNIDDDEEGSTDDEGEDSLDLSNMFDEIPQDTEDIIETIDALQQDLFSPHDTKPSCFTFCSCHTTTATRANQKTV